MASNAPDPPGAQPEPNPPDGFPSPSKTQEIQSAVVATFSQDFSTQSSVQYTQADVPPQNTNYEELVKFHTTAPISTLSSEGDARNEPFPQDPTNNQNVEAQVPTLSFTTGAAMVATPSYCPSTAVMPPTKETENPLPLNTSNAAQTSQGLSGGVNEASKLDDFITHIRFNPLPPDLATGEITMNTGELQELQYVTNCLKQELNNAYMGYSYYYTTNDIRVHPHRNVDIPEGDINAAHKLLIVALDAGFGAPRTTMPYKILTSTSWHRLVFSLMGAILRGAIRSDQFRKYGRDSLNGIADHVIIQEGLPRPNRFGQLISAMANQLATLADPEGHYPGDHHTKMYEKAAEAVSDKIQAALLAKARRAVTPADEEAARTVVWTELIQEAKEGLQADQEQKARVEAEVAKLIVTSLHTESQQTINEWRAAWMEGLKAAIREEPFQPRATLPPQSQLLRENEIEARAAIALRLQEVKQEFLAGLKQQIARDQDEYIQAEATQKYNILVTERVLSLERSLAAQHDQRIAEAKARAEAEIAQEMEPWKAHESERLKSLFSAKTAHEVASGDTALLKVAADKLGFDMVERAQPTKKQRIDPDAGHKRSRSGSRARRTPSPSKNARVDMDITPTKADRPERGRPLTVAPLELTDNSRVAKLQQVADDVQQKKLAAGQTAKASMHNPSNQMTDDPEMQARARGETVTTVPGEVANTAPTATLKEDPVLTAVLAGIHNLTAQFNSRFDSFASRLTNLEHKVEETQKPSDPRLRRAPTHGTQTASEKTPAPRALPPGPTLVTPDPVTARPTEPSPQPPPKLPLAQPVLSESSWPTLGRTANRPQPDPIMAPDPWVKVVRASTVKSQEAAQDLARSFAAAQGRTPSGRRQAGRGPPAPSTALTTRVTVVRDGGLTDPAAEAALREAKPEHIVMAARTTAEALSTETIQILGGHWAGSAGKTGNFVYTINGKIPFTQILPYAAALISPLKVGRLVPLDGWLWTQFRGVPTTGPDGVIYDSDALTNELLRNPAFHGVTLCMLAHWQKKVERLMQDNEATLQVSYLDETGEVTKHIQRSEVHMFGRKVKFFVIGNNPRLVQCSRCHELGHEARSPSCKLPANALRCHLCGGSHHSTTHDFHCNGTHKSGGRCDCKLKCILCKGFGHHARSRNCPKRGNFAPPPLSKHEGTARVPTQQHTPLTASTQPGSVPSPPPPVLASRDEIPSVPTPEDLTPTQREPTVQKESPPLPKKKGRKKGGGGKRKAGKPPQADNSFSISDTLTFPVPPLTAGIDDNPYNPYDNPYGGISSSKGWGNPGDEDEFITDPDLSQPDGITQLHRAPAIRTVEATMLLSAEALWEHYVRTDPGEGPSALWHKEIELGWGGMRNDTDLKTHEAVGLRARYAAQYLLPTTKPEVIAALCKGLHPSKQPAHLQETDKEWGGDGSGAQLTAMNYFSRNAPCNLLLVHNGLPLTVERAVEALKTVDDYDLCLMTEEYDLQMGGTGSGTHFFHSIPHDILDANPAFQARLMTMQTPPNLRHPLGKAASAVAEHARVLTTNGTRIGPPLSYESASRLLQNYCVDADLPLNCITVDLVYDVAATHTPDVPWSCGLPAYRNLKKHIREACRAAVPDPSPPTHVHG